MARKAFAAASVGLLLAPLPLLALATSTAVAAPRAVTVQLHAKPITIAPDGSATVVMFIRCASGLNAFEYGAGVRQGDVVGGTSVGPTANVVRCDGARQRVEVPVTPSAGEFSPGRATLDANVSLFDPAEDGDLFVTATRTVRLR